MHKNELLVRAQALCNQVYEAGEIDLLPLVFFEEERQDLIEFWQEMDELLYGYYARCEDFANIGRKYHRIYLTPRLLDAPWEFVTETVLHEIAHARHYEVMASDEIRETFPEEEFHNEVWESLFEDLRIVFMPRGVS